MKKLPLLLFVALTSVLCSQEATPRRPMALLIMLDGMRADALFNTHMPNLHALMKGEWHPDYKGAFSDCAQALTDAKPSSATNHAAIATGVTATKHRVFNNGQTKDGNFKEWPSWLGRLADTKPQLKTYFLYTWGENDHTAPHPKVKGKRGPSDAANGRELAQLLATKDAPEATMIFVDWPDAGGHGTGFYPYGTSFVRAQMQSDMLVGNLMKAIASRETFAQEDWLLMITADHGGMSTSHGMWGGQASTIPIVMAGRHISQGQLAGIPNHYDLPVTALAHFGLDVSTMKLDGKVIGKQVQNPAKRPLKQGLQAYFTFDDKEAKNLAGTNIKATLLGGEDTASGLGNGFADGFLRVPGFAGHGVALEGTEKLQFENKTNFSITMWVRLPESQIGDPAIISNKDWNSGQNPGFVLNAGKRGDGAPWTGVGFNYARSGKVNRADLNTFHIEPREWVFYAVVLQANGAAYVYQGRRDGNLHWIAEHAEDIVINTGMKWHIGQDGTGNYKAPLNGDIDDLAIWNRAITFDDVRKIYQAGRNGMSLGDILE
ncbi:MAG: hypothetical protein GX561_02815 [Lentisphaerae bacterium]|jgi:hypothetical protein|nr:hypothetical protein [Lentisphaerota bacterium]